MQPGSIVGVGTGSTVNCFIDALGTMKDRIAGAVSSSRKAPQRLQAHGIVVLDSNSVERIPVYIDGADEIDHGGCMIKGGGAARREKIVADLAERFCHRRRIQAACRCWALPAAGGGDRWPARRWRAASAALGGRRCCAGVVTDNGSCILDVVGSTISDPLTLEAEINQWPGVVTVGIFARHRAGVCLLGTPPA